jgi:uncharacterized protein (TIGR03435 family)
MTASFMASIAIKTTVILALGLGALRLRRQSRAALRHLLLLAVLATVFVLPIAALVLPVFAVPLPDRVPLMAAATASESQSGVALMPLPDAAVTRSVTHSSGRMSITQLVLMVEGLGATLAVFPLIAGLWQTRRLRLAARRWPRGQTRIERLASGAGIRRHVDVLVHDDLPGPVTCGVWRPVLLFPADAARWDGNDFEHAAIHELEHVRRNDWATDCFARLVCALYWFHPLAWMTWRRLRLESERAADDAVAREREATAYADLLVTFAQRLAAGERNYVIAMANRRELPTRIRALLDESRPRGRAGRRCIATTALVAAGVVLGIAPLGIATDVPIAAADQVSPDPRPVMVPQTAERPSFEVASLRRNVSVGQLSSMNAAPGGRMLVTNHSLLNIIRQVYRLQRYQITGGPDWIDRDHWDIVAKAAGDAPFDQLLLMMETLLADRFKLLAHRETREMPVYALVLTRDDGRLGSQITPSTIDCDAIAAAVKSGAAPPPPAFGGPRCGININNNVLRMSAKRMTDLARNLSIMTDRFVVDRTGLNGSFDLELRWNEADGPSLATAVQEQLGLKLEAQRAGVDVLVIDSAQRPAED